MRSLHNKPKSTNRRAGRAQKTDAGLTDAASDKLAKLSKQGGNQALQAQLAATEGRRDELLKFITARLGTIQGIQDKELAQGRREREWFREVAKGVKGYALPDATRWHDAARLYQEAGKALCAGHLGRGVELLEKAQEAERAALESAPQQVRDELKADERRSPEQPEAATGVASGAACQACSRPAELSIAEQILAVTERPRNSPPLKATGRNWWDELEEDEEEEDEEDG